MSADTPRVKAPPAERESPWATRIPVLVIAIAFIGSIFVIASARREETPPGTTATIRIGHWQLEGGVRDGINEMIAEYRKIHPEVNIIQDAIPEGTYPTWLTTQLMGGTAPDILEAGMVQYAILIGYLKRYFLPLTDLAIVPNPYNKGTELEDVPWSATFRDGMRSGYYEEMGEYMAVPLSQFGSSLFCNMSLLKELTGRDESPEDLREFLEVCEEIKRHKNDQGIPYVPIASSNYHWGMWDGILFDPATFGAIPHADFTHDGYVGVDELFIGIKSGTIGFDFPGFRAKFKLIDQMVGNFQTGFTGLGRDEAVFLFVQGRAVFISTGTWDAGGLVDQASALRDRDGNPVKLSIVPYPYPSRDDPDYGEIFPGPVYQKPYVGFPFGVTRCSKHPEIAMDFLRFMGSKAGNARLNNAIGWIPSVVDTPMPPLLEKLLPNLRGIYSAMPVSPGGDTIVKWTQLYDLYKVGQISFDDLIAQYRPYYLEHGEEEIAEIIRNNRRGQPGDEQMASRYLVSALRTSGVLAPVLGGERGGAFSSGLTGSDKEEYDWARYRNYSRRTLVSRPLGESRINRLLADGARHDPYELSPIAEERFRARVRAMADGAPAGGDSAAAGGTGPLESRSGDGAAEEEGHPAPDATEEK